MRSARWLLPLGPAVSVSSHSLAASEFCPVLCIFLKLFDLLLASCMGELLLFLLDLLAKQSLLVASPKLKLALHVCPHNGLSAHYAGTAAKAFAAFRRSLSDNPSEALGDWTVRGEIDACGFCRLYGGAEHPCAKEDNVHVPGCMLWDRASVRAG